MSDNSFARALQCFQQGQLTQAQHLCEALLQSRQHDAAEVWHLLGLIAYQSGDLPAAERALKQAVQLRPGVPEFQINLGHVLRDSNQPRQAVRHYEKALKKQDSTDLRLWLAGALRDSGQAAKARQQLKQALRLAPEHPQIWYQLGLLAQSLQDLPEALAAYQQAMRYAPGFAQAFHNAGFVLQQLARPDEAFAHYRRALELKPDYVQAAYNLGLLFESRQDTAQAASCYARALQMDPTFTLAALNWSHLLADSRPAEAIQLLEQMLAMPQNQSETELWLQLGNLQQQTGHEAAARAAYEALLQLQPAHPGAHYNLGRLAQQQGDFSAAQAAYAHALELAPDGPQQAQVHYAQACLNLLQGHFAEGWAGYSSRWALPHAETPQAPELPEWQGQDLQGQILWVYGEQGFGDQIQFLRYLPLLRQRLGLDQLCLAVAPPLLRLAQAMQLDCDRIVALQPPESWRAEAPAGFRVALLSLPGLLGTTRENIPPCAGWCPLPSVSLTGTGRRIGWVWAAGQARDPVGAAAYRLKSLEPAQLMRFAALPGTQSYALQIGPDRLSAEALSGDFAWLQDLSPQMHDFLDTAAYLQQLDLVITVDTAVAHLAGSLGRPTWLLLPCVPDWRWLLERPDSPWYPGMRLFRQPRPGDWAAVLDAVAEALQA